MAATSSSSSPCMIASLRSSHRCRLSPSATATSPPRLRTLPPRRCRRNPSSSSSSSRQAAAISMAPANPRHRLIAPIHAAAAAAGGGGGGGAGATSPSGLPSLVGIAHLLVSLGIVLASDKFLKQAFAAASIKFPSALFGMFCVFSVLVVLDAFAPALAKGFMDFFEPATLFIQRWLPLFYVPSLVVLPLAVRDVPAASGLKIFLIIFGGWFASLMVAGYTALTVRKIVQTQLIPAEPMSKPSPFATLEFWAWGAVFVASFAVAYVNPTALGTTARTCLPFLLASTVLGYMVGSGLPSGVKKVLHPIICCALSADLAAIAYGYLSRSGVDAVLGDYLTKAPSNPGAGDVLMGFLGSVIISFAFSMFKQRKLVKRHAAEIFTSIAIASTFSLYSTAILGRVIGLEPSLTISILPRCITVALALSIVSFFEGVNSSLTAAVVVLTGLIGANFVQAAMDKLGLNDPIARGIGTASSAHGLGTAALSAKEPEALPFCAIAYGLTGIFGSLICSVPAVRQSLVFIAG
ncbi:plastidal glycolate/glycerate translocator 1, chloroplastic-like [Oryza glaberrima]|uniref:LrgB-like family protein n=1 Tax=Oryza glaberrima TaxID=4538 RepID=I1NNJ0_ORYGL|nr:plastidal glycolate/glycerate translocator 1, chloroplastic-like [Oryza glaberrima]